jgi:beta-lactamase class A
VTAWRRIGRLVLGVTVVVASLGLVAGRSSAAPGPLPDSPVGTQLTWFLGAVASAPLADSVIEAHFDASFLAKVSPTTLNSVLTQDVPSSAASLVAIVSEEPASLVVVASFGGQLEQVTISVDSAGLIDGLLLSPYVPPSPTSWAQIDRVLKTLGPHVGFLAARVSPSGKCAPIHELDPSTARPLGSEFKLFVLGALAHKIASGGLSWKQELTVTAALKSVGSESGSLQNSPDGTKVSVHQTAVKMISISDNTAADMLIHLVGRTAVEAQDRQWSTHAALNTPFLTTRELFLLHYAHYPGLAHQYLGLPPAKRAAFLVSSVDPVALNQIQGVTTPRAIDSLEWFASPDDICRAFSGLHQLSTKSSLAPLGSVLSVNDGDIGLNRTTWPTIWFKGGSEPGVLTLGYLAQNAKHQTFVVSAMVSNPGAALSPAATEDLLSIVKGAFTLVR